MFINFFLTFSRDFEKILNLMQISNSLKKIATTVTKKNLQAENFSQSKKSTVKRPKFDTLSGENIFFLLIFFS